MRHWRYVYENVGREEYRSVKFWRHLLVSDAWIYMFSDKGQIHEGVNRREYVLERKMILI